MPIIICWGARANMAHGKSPSLFNTQHPAASTIAILLVFNRLSYAVAEVVQISKGMFNNRRCSETAIQYAAVDCHGFAAPNQPWSKSRKTLPPPAPQRRSQVQSYG